MIRTSTPTGPGAVTAAFCSGSRSNSDLDDTVEGEVDLGDLSDSEVIILGQKPVPQDVTSGDDSDSDTMDTEDLNRQMRARAREDDGADADDEDDAPDAQHGRHLRFLYGGSFGSDQEEEGDADGDGVERPDDDPDNAADASPPCPPNTGTQWYREAGPSIQDPIKNFVDTDYPEDVGIWKPTAMYPMDNVKHHDLVFT